MVQSSILLLILSRVLSELYQIWDWPNYTCLSLLYSVARTEHPEFRGTGCPKMSRSQSIKFQMQQELIAQRICSLPQIDGKGFPHTFEVLEPLFSRMIIPSVSPQLHVKLCESYIVSLLAAPFQLYVNFQELFILFHITVSIMYYYGHFLNHQVGIAGIHKKLLGSRALAPVPFFPPAFQACTLQWLWYVFVYVFSFHRTSFLDSSMSS